MASRPTRSSGRLTDRLPRWRRVRLGTLQAGGAERFRNGASVSEDRPWPKGGHARGDAQRPPDARVPVADGRGRGDRLDRRACPCPGGRVDRLRPRPPGGSWPRGGGERAGPPLRPGGDGRLRGPGRGDVRRLVVQPGPVPPRGDRPARPRLPRRGRPGRGGPDRDRVGPPARGRHRRQGRIDARGGRCRLGERADPARPARRPAGRGHRGRHGRPHGGTRPPPARPRRPQLRRRTHRSTSSGARTSR